MANFEKIYHRVALQIIKRCHGAIKITKHGKIVETVRTLQQENWNTEELKNQVTDLLKIHDELVGKMRSLQGDDHSCDCGHDHE